MKIQMIFNQKDGASEMHITEMTAGELDGLRILLQTIRNYSGVLDGVDGQLSLKQVIQQFAEENN